MSPGWIIVVLRQLQRTAFPGVKLLPLERHPSAVQIHLGNHGQRGELQDRASAFVRLLISVVNLREVLADGRSLVHDLPEIAGNRGDPDTHAQ